MTPSTDAIARYHRLLESEVYRDLSWAESLQSRMRDSRLMESGRLIAPILRPHFVSKSQFSALTRAAEHLSGILGRIESTILQTPSLLSRMHMLPAEKMLAAIPSGYSRSSVTSCLDAHLQNGFIHFRGFQASNPAGIAYADRLADLFCDLPILKDFKKGHYKVAKLCTGKHLLAAILKAWSEFGGTKLPNVAIMECQRPFGAGSNEGHLLTELFAKGGVPARLIFPDCLEYTGQRLRASDFEIDIVFGRIRPQELLVRSDLSHPLLRAYQDRAVCMVNSFRSEIAQRPALFDLLTDDQVTENLSADDRKLIHKFIPWTRIVRHTKTKHGERDIDLPDFISRNREQLVLRPNDESAQLHTFVGANMGQSAWDYALLVALRFPYVVQEQVCRERETFPVFQYGALQWKEAEISVHPHTFNGKVQGASAVLYTSSGGFTTPFAISPVLVLEEN